MARELTIVDVQRIEDEYFKIRKVINSICIEEKIAKNGKCSEGKLLAILAENYPPECFDTLYENFKKFAKKELNLIEFLDRTVFKDSPFNMTPQEFDIALQNLMNKDKK